MPLLTRQGESVTIPARVAQRALEKFFLDAYGCHISTYSRGHQGYAQVGWQGEDGRHMVGAHRAAWTAIHGQIPTGLTVDHKCRMKSCVKVSHLRLLSNNENAKDGSALGALVRWGYVA